MPEPDFKNFEYHADMLFEYHANMLAEAVGWLLACRDNPEANGIDGASSATAARQILIDYRKFQNKVIAYALENNPLEAREPQPSETIMSEQNGDYAPTHTCGLPMVRNPHPQAGEPAVMLEVGCMWECIPCLTKTRHAWSGRAMRAETALAEVQSELRDGLEYYERGVRLSVGKALGIIGQARRPQPSTSERNSDD